MPASFSFAVFGNAPTGLNPDAITAATIAQATATLLTGAMNVVTTGVGETGVRLQANHPVGSLVSVRVTSATAGLLFPPVGGAINGGSVNASFSMAQNKPALCLANPNGLDYVVVLSA